MASDYISREAVLNTLDTMDKALDEGRTVEAYKELLAECYKELPGAQPCEDAVSREAVIEALKKLEQDDIELYGVKIPEGFDAEEAVEAVRKLPPVNTELARWNKLYIWLNDMRFGIAPDETTPEKDQAERWALVGLLDDIMAWMKPDEWPFSDPYEEGESE